LTIYDHNETTPAQTAASLLDPFALLMALYRKRWIVAIIAAIVVGLTLAYLLQAQSLYRATAQVLLNQQQRQPFEDANSAVNLGRDPFFVDSQVAVIASISVLRPVVIEQNLVDDPEFGDGGQGGGFLSGIFQAVTGGLLQSSSDGASSERLVVDTIEALRDALRVSRQGATYVIDITVESQSSQKAAVLANAVAESYLALGRTRNTDQTGAFASDLENQIGELRNQVRTAEEKVQKFRAENNLQNVSGGTLLVNNELEGLNQQLVQAQSALAESDASYNEIQRFLEQKLSLSSLGDLVVSQSINQLLDQYNTAVRNEAALANQFLPSHPSLGQARAQVTRLEGLIRNELSGLSEAKRVERDVAQNRVKNLEAQIDRTRKSSSVDEALLITLRELESDAAAIREVYQNVLAKSKEVANLEQFTVPVAQIISPAIPPQNPSWPRKKLILAASGVFGVLLGIMLVLALEAVKLARLLLSSRMPDTNAPARAVTLQPAEPVETGLRPPPRRMERRAAPAPVARSGGRRLAGTNLGMIPSLSGPQITSYQVLKSGDAYEAAFDYLTSENNRRLPREGRAFIEAVDSLEETLASGLRRSAGSTVLVTTREHAEDLHFAAFSIACASAARGNRVLLIDGDPQYKELSRVVDTAGGSLGGYFVDKDNGPDGLELDFVSLVDHLPKYKEFSLSERQIYKLDRLASDYDLVVIAAGQSEPETPSPFMPLADCSLDVTQDWVSGSLLISHTDRG